MYFMCANTSLSLIINHLVSWNTTQRFTYGQWILTYTCMITAVMRTYMKGSSWLTCLDMTATRTYRLYTSTCTLIAHWKWTCVMPTQRTKTPKLPKCNFTMRVVFIKTSKTFKLILTSSKVKCVSASSTFNFLFVFVFHKAKVFYMYFFFMSCKFYCN